MDSHTRFMEQVLLNLTQAWNGNAQQQKNVNELYNPSKQKTHMGMMRHPQRS